MLRVASVDFAANRSKTHVLESLQIPLDLLSSILSFPHLIYFQW